MKSIRWKRLVVSIITTQAAGITGAFFTVPAIPTWYAGLVKPTLTPPNWIFGPVWTTLYLLMGISLYLVWNAQHPGKKKALWVFFVHLVVNFLWSFLFFGLQSPLLGCIAIIFLLMLILYAIKLFGKITNNAAYLLVPYLLWTTFATYLNFSILLLN